MDASPSLWGHDPPIYTSGSSRSHINLVGRALAGCTQSLPSAFVDTQERFPGGCHVGKLCRLFANNEPPTGIHKSITEDLLLEIYDDPLLKIRWSLSLEVGSTNDFYMCSRVWVRAEGEEGKGERWAAHLE